MVYCTVLDCRNNSAYKNLSQGGISYHRFPKDRNIKGKWIEATGRKDWMPSKSSVICSIHFQDKDFLITKKGYRYICSNAIPTRNVVIFQEQKQLDTSITGSSKKRASNFLNESSFSSEVPLKQAQMDTSPTITKKEEISTQNPQPSHSKDLKHMNSPSSSSLSTPRKKKLGGMLRWTRNALTKKQLKIKRLQTQNRRLKLKVESMEQILTALEEKFAMPYEDLLCLKNTNVEVKELVARHGVLKKNKLRDYVNKFHVHTP